MKISVLLPYKENFSPSYAGAVSLFVNDTTKLSKYKNNTVVFGISGDSIESHLKFKKKYKLKFELLSDEKKVVLKKYGVWGKKAFMGKKYMGIIRTTILINAKGKVHKIWNNVRVKDHAKEVLDTIKNI